MWTSIEPLLQAMADDESRCDGVKRLGVDEHVWHHVSEFPVEDGGRGPKQLTGMVDLTPDEDGKPRARLLDLVPGRSGKAYSDWLEERGDDFKNGVEVATLDPFHGYENAIDDQLEDAVAVLDAFHVVKLGTQAVDEVRRRVQQEIHGHRGRKNDPLYGIRTILRCGQEKLTERQRARLDRAIVADERHDEVLVAWLCAQQLRSADKAKNPVEGRRIAEKVLASLPTCPIPEIKRLGKTLKHGARRSWPTSTPAARTTAAPKRSTASSNSTAAVPAASATGSTTDYACCPSAADCPTPTSGRKSRIGLPAAVRWSVGVRTGGRGQSQGRG